MKVVLIVAGSDSSGGAGLQADIKTGEYFGVFTTTAVTALTAQNTLGVTGVVDTKPEFLKAQISAILSDFEISAIKVGMLSNSSIIEVMREFLSSVKVPVVLDPVFISKAGSLLMSKENIQNLKNLFKFATIITPNIYEAKCLFGDDLDIKADANVVIKNIKIGEKSVDRLYYKDGKILEFKSDFLDSENLHGTGCSFSTAIASNLALGKNLEDAIKISKKYIHEAILQAPNLGHGKGPLRHNLRKI